MTTISDPKYKVTRADQFLSAEYVEEMNNIAKKILGILELPAEEVWSLDNDGQSEFFFDFEEEFNLDPRDFELEEYDEELGWFYKHMELPIVQHDTTDHAVTSYWYPVTEN